MTGLALILIAFAIADLVAGGLAGQPVSAKRAVWGVSSCTVIVLFGGYCFDFNWLLTIITAVSAAAAVSVWLFLKPVTVKPGGFRKPQFALVWIGLILGATFLLTPLWPTQLVGGIEQWLSKIPTNASKGWNPVNVFTYIGVILFLSAPANSIVRLTLTVVGTDWRKSQEKLRGGRLIGVLERWLIFGLATAGEPTAAALIVSAKSLLRFPELNRAGTDSNADSDQPAEVDIVTEYFLLGSLLSWSLALFPSLLFI